MELKGGVGSGSGPLIQPLRPASASQPDETAESDAAGDSGGAAPSAE